MSFSLTNNFFANARAVTFTDGGGVTWSFNKNTNSITATVSASSVSPLTTKGDIWGFSTVNARIPVGSNGNVLTADSTQTLGVKWAPVATSPLTTKGDLWGFSSVDARVPVGSDGSVLTADSTQTLGVKWAPPSSAMLQLAQTMFSGSWFIYTADNASSSTLLCIGGVTALIAPIGTAAGVNPDNPPSSTLLGAMHRVTYSSAATVSASAGTGLSANQTQYSYTSITASALGGGFSLQWQGAFVTARSDQRAFIGFVPGPSSLGTTADPSTFLNSIGFGKDQADTNLQFMYNAGSGTATKTSTGVAFTSLLNVPLMLSISAPAGGGTVTVSLTNISTGAVIFSGTILNSDPKYIAANTRIFPAFWCNTGSATSTAVVIAVSKFVLITPAIMT